MDRRQFIAGTTAAAIAPSLPVSAGVKAGCHIEAECYTLYFNGIPFQALGEIKVVPVQLTGHIGDS